MKKGDLLIFILFLSIGMTGIILVKQSKHKAKIVKIETSYNNFEIPLKDTVLFIKGKLGKMTVVIKDKKVWVSESPCPRKICILTGKIKNPGEVIICIPNGVYISIESSEDLDGITY